MLAHNPGGLEPVIYFVHHDCLAIIAEQVKRCLMTPAPEFAVTLKCQFAFKIIRKFFCVFLKRLRAYHQSV